MAKVVKKSWKPQTTSTKRWKKRKTTSQPRSRGNSKVLKIYKKTKRSLHTNSRKKYSPKFITTSRIKKRARRSN
ncbi:STP3 protein, partial [Crocuta crocuta]